MAKKPYRHPYPCDYHPRFTSQHDAHVFVEEFMKYGDIKNCSHLRVDPFNDGFHANEYGPVCAKDSFKVKEIESYHYPQNFFYGCPKDCRLYEPAWKGKAKRRLQATYRSIRNGIRSSREFIIELARAISSFCKSEP